MRMSRRVHRVAVCSSQRRVVVRCCVKKRRGTVATMRLAQDHTAALQARRHARRWSNENHLPETAVADIELVVAELVNNAVMHAPPPYAFEIFHVNGTVRGEVH